MAHITSFEINGLNGRSKSLQHTLDRHINVFFGSNGAGKTSVLRLLDSAMANETKSITKVAFESASVGIHSIDFEREFTMSIQKNVDINKQIENFLQSPVGLKVTKEIRHSVSETDLARNIKNSNPLGWWNLSPEHPNKSITSGWTHIFLPAGRLYLDFDRDRPGIQRNIDVLDAEMSLDRAFATAVQELWSQKYGEILGRVKEIQQRALESIFLDALRPREHALERNRAAETKRVPLNPGRVYERLFNFLKRQSGSSIRGALGSPSAFAARLENDAALRRTVDRIDRVEADIEREMRPIEQISNLFRKLFNKGKSISFDGPRIVLETDEGSNIGLEYLSSGEKHLLRIFLAAMKAGENSLIIDEPEMSMHIDWQRELISNIRTLNPHCQLIFATHSPEIMADVSDDKIFRI